MSRCRDPKPKPMQIPCTLRTTAEGRQGKRRGHPLWGLVGVCPIERCPGFNGSEEAGEALQLYLTASKRYCPDWRKPCWSLENPTFNPRPAIRVGFQFFVIRGYCAQLNHVQKPLPSPAAAAVR